MLTLLKTYQKYKPEIERFILDNIENNAIFTLDEENLRRFFTTFTSLQLLYVTDEKYQQYSPSFNRNLKDMSKVGKSRTEFFISKRFNEKGEYISTPYICSITGKTVITVIKKVDNKYLVMDFNIVVLLQDLGYVTHVQFFTKMNKFIYALIGYGLMLLSFVLILYSFLSFSSYLFEDASLIDITFKSIISLTLSLAVFDLGKNLLEHEVVFKENDIETHSDYKMFIKFLISIITALSIEALMLVLKISLTKNYGDIVHSVWLILGVSFMIMSVGIFYKMTNKK